MTPLLAHVLFILSVVAFCTAETFITIRILKIHFPEHNIYWPRSQKWRWFDFLWFPVFALSIYFTFILPGYF